MLGRAEVFFYGEELGHGAVAKAILDGVSFGGPLDRAYEVYEGGAFFFAHLKALAFTFLGPSVLALKIVAVAWAAAILLAGVHLTRGVFGDLAAGLFGLLFVLAPASRIRLEVLGIGIHPEALLFTAVLLDLAAGHGLAAPPSRGRSLRLGLTAGLGVFFSYQCVLSVALAAGILAAVAGRERLRRAAAPAGLGLLGGLLPLVWMVSQAGGRVFEVHGRSLLAMSLGDLAPSRSLGPVVAAFLAADWGSNLQVLAPVAAALLGTASLLLSRRRGGEDRNDPGLDLAGKVFLAWVAFIPFFWFAYAAGGFAHTSLRFFYNLGRLSPVWFAGTALVAAAAAGLMNGWVAGGKRHGTGAARGFHAERVRRLAGACLALAALVPGILDHARLLGAASLGDPRLGWELLEKTKGYDYDVYFGQIAPRLQGSRRERLAALTAFDEADPGMLLPAAARAIYGRGAVPWSAIVSELREAFPKRWTTALLGLGSRLAPDPREGPRRILARVDRFPPAARPLLEEAAGRRDARSARLFQLTREARAMAASNGHDRWWKGFAWRLYLRYRLRPDRAREFVRRLPARVRPAVLEGLAIARAAHQL